MIVHVVYVLVTAQCLARDPHNQQPELAQLYPALIDEYYRYKQHASLHL